MFCHNISFLRKMFIALWTIIICLAIFYMISRLVKSPKKGPHQSQNHFNNNSHNPALVNNMQILLVGFIFILAAIPGILFTNNGPNGFILGSLPGIVAALMFVPGLFYAFNSSLRKFVIKEAKEAFRLNPNEVQNIESNCNRERF